MRAILFLTSLFFFVGSAFSENVTDIHIEIKGYKNDTIVFGGYYGGERVPLKTILRGADGKFAVRSENLLPQGMYFIQFKPKADYFEFILDSDQKFSISIGYPHTLDKPVCIGSVENELFFRCLQVVNVNREEADRLMKMIALMQYRDPELAAIKQRALDDLNENVVQQQLYFTQKKPNSIVHKYVTASRLPVPDEYNPEDSLQRVAADKYVLTHYFDNIDFNDQHLLRSPYPYNMIQGYLSKNLDSSESLVHAVDRIMKFVLPATSNRNAYFNFLTKLLSSSRPKLLEDAYVHLMLDYVKAGKTPWVSKTDSSQLVALALRKEPLLVGKPAPDLVLQNKDGNNEHILDGNARLTVLYFGEYNCSGCQEGVSGLLEFYDFFKDRDVDVVGICTNEAEQFRNCFRYAEQNHVNFRYLADPVNGRKALEVFNLKNEPTLFLLDRNKRIVAKNLVLPELYKLVNAELAKDKM